ncbi:MAG TPA: hypothetical protein VMY99_00770 [Nevskiaceae bacterium]|nr:hypothetical protein [Nevskiaceae bacterium]
MRKKLVALCMAASLLFPVMALPGTAGAVNIFTDTCSGAAANTDVCRDARPTSTNPIIATMKVVLNVLSVITGIAAVIMVIVGGLRMITASGDPGNFSKGRQGVIYAAIGLAVTALSQAIVVLVLNRIA